MKLSTHISHIIPYNSIYLPVVNLSKKQKRKKSEQTNEKRMKKKEKNSIIYIARYNRARKTASTHRNRSLCEHSDRLPRRFSVTSMERRKKKKKKRTVKAVTAKPKAIKTALFGGV